MVNIFQSLFDTSSTATIALPSFLFCIAVSLAIGAFIAGMFCIKNSFSKSFVVALALLPAVVCVVIMMVNGNIGAGVAVAGAFSLVRFRSAQGSAREIVAIFLAMGAGMVAGMGYLAYAGVFALILGAALAVCNVTGIGEKRENDKDKIIRITIPEDLDYTTVFDDLMKKYTVKSKLVQVKTTNMGSMFKLTYHVTLRNPAREKQMIDELRIRNGNLEINVSRQEALQNAL